MFQFATRPNPPPDRREIAAGIPSGNNEPKVRAEPAIRTKAIRIDEDPNEPGRAGANRMQRRAFLFGGAGGLAVGAMGLPPLPALGAGAVAFGAFAGAQSDPEPHFPDALHQFIWRNWELAGLDRMAEVAGCRPEDLRAIGESMGLGPKPELSADQLRRIYISVIRQNWYLLPNEQIIQLLGWTPERFEFALKEDDFLAIKLGPKVDCPKLVYAEPNDEAKQKAASIREVVRGRLGSELDEPGEPAFRFVERLSDTHHPSRRNDSAKAAADQVDLSTGWSVGGEGEVHPKMVERLSTYLHEAMKAQVDPKAERALTLRIDPKLGQGKERFVVTVEPDRVEVAANGETALGQAIGWVQDQMEFHGGPFLDQGRTEREARSDPRFLYSYFALYGDPLMEPDIDPFPDGYLDRLRRVGVNGVWMQCVLSEMAPAKDFPEFGEGSETRLANLAKLIERVNSHGMKIYLYINEPRTRPAEFFKGREETRGAEQGDGFAMCAADQKVRDWIADSLTHIFERAPGLGGVFSITMSENPTNCFSHGRQTTCPRCSGREIWDGVGDVLEAIHRGVRRASQTAEVIAWDWGWTEPLATNLIPRLPKDSRFQSVSEWSIPIERGGVKAVTGEYSISVVGPGPRATAHWALADKAGVATMSKCQFNNTWELSATPYIPALNLVARHGANLAKAGVSGLQESWTLGGYPSPNLEAIKEIAFGTGDPVDVDAVLKRVANNRYGEAAAPKALEAWKAYSDAFEEFPYGVAIYIIPAQHGPANLLRVRPSGRPSGMILFPQDNYKSWAGAYPPEVARDQFAKVAEGWERALPLFREIVDLTPAARRDVAAFDLAIAETCAIHFRSVANQFAFYILRDAPADDANRAKMRELVVHERELAQRLYGLALRHSALGYEASNHYYYRPADLAEKILNCEHILNNELA